jgi:hypothetical protein
VKAKIFTEQKKIGVTPEQAEDEAAAAGPGDTENSKQ